MFQGGEPEAKGSGEAKNLGPRVGRCSSRRTVLDSDSDFSLVSRGRFSILSSKSDNDEEGAGQSVVVAVADAQETAIGLQFQRKMLAGDARGCEFPKPPQWQSLQSFDLTQHDVSGSDTPSLERSAPRPTRRLTLVGARKKWRCRLWRRTCPPISQSNGLGLNS